MTWNVNRRSHHWVTLDGDNYSCNDCDTKTGSQPCPEIDEMLDAQIGDYLATKADREADQLADYGKATYNDDAPDNPFNERPF